MKDKIMTALALNTTGRSPAFLSSFIDALDKAITMAKAVHHDSANAADMKKVRAIPETISRVIPHLIQPGNRPKLGQTFDADFISRSVVR